jgi:hypothetical protein
VPVKDSLEMALKVEAPTVESLKEGVEMTLKQLSSAFERNRLLPSNRPRARTGPEQAPGRGRGACRAGSQHRVAVLQKAI